MSNSARGFLRKDDVNPSVWEAMQSFRSTIAYGYGTGSEERIEQYTEWQKVYWSVRGKAWTWGLSIWLSLILAVPFAIQLGKPYLGIAILSWFAIGGLGSLITYLVGLQTVAIPEMRFMVGRAKLDPVQKLYGEALCDLYRSSFSDEFRKEIQVELNGLLDDYDKLRIQREAMHGIIENSSRRESIVAEITSLNHKVAGANDEIAKQTLEESLQVAQKRLRKFEQGAPVLERTDAQIELMMQTIAALSDSVRQIQDAPMTASSELSGLRSRIGSVRAQTEAISTAYEELGVMRA